MGERLERGSGGLKPGERKRERERGNKCRFEFGRACALHVCVEEGCSNVPLFLEIAAPLVLRGFHADRPTNPHVSPRAHGEQAMEQEK